MASLEYLPRTAVPARARNYESSSNSPGTGLTDSGGSLALADTGVTAGTYQSANLTINAQGQVTAATSNNDTLEQGFFNASAQIVPIGENVVFANTVSTTPNISINGAGVVTVGRKGIYHVEVSLFVGNNSQPTAFTLNKNLGTRLQQISYPASEGSRAMSTILSMNANDTIMVQSDGTNADIRQNLVVPVSYFKVTLLQPLP